jgi:hypothetical protein
MIKKHYISLIIFYGMLFFICGLNHKTAAQDTSQMTFSLLTAAPGDQAYNIFGHTALRMNSKATGQDVVFNYGTFDPSMDYFILKFLRGKLPYKLSTSKYENFLKTYNNEGRAIWEQPLNLDDEGKMKMFAFLENNYLPENREYLYDFFFDNCSTRIRDLFESELPGFNYVDVEEKDITYRQMLDEYLQGKEWTDLGIDLIIGSIADAKADYRHQMFLPDYLHNYAFNMSYDKGTQTALVSKSDKVLLIDRIKHKSFLITPMKLFLFFLLLELFLFISAPAQHWGLVRIYDNVWYAAISVVCIVVAFMWLGTDHQACGANYNLLWANPLFVLILISSLRKNISLKALTFCTILLTGVVLLWSFLPQQFHLATLPIILLFILKNVRLIRNKLRVDRNVISVN